MSTLNEWYATQPSGADEWRALQAEAAERGMPMIEVEREHVLAAQDRRVADIERVRARIAQGHMVWRDGGYTWELPTAEPEPPVQEPPAERFPGVPSSGRQISPPRRSRS